jgi:hypothetical protein
LAQNPLDYANSNTLNRGDLGGRHAVFGPDADARKVRAGISLVIGCCEGAGASARLRRTDVGSSDYIYQHALLRVALDDLGNYTDSPVFKYLLGRLRSRRLFPNA